MSNINKVIGRNLSMLRKNFKLTQLELAEKFNYSDKSISKWESGESLPSVEVLFDLATFYGVTLNDLSNPEFKVNEKPQKPIRDRLFPAKLIITLLATSVVWLAATIIFVTLQLVCNVNYPLAFLWAVPLSCIVLVVFNSIWGRNYLLFPILSILVWSTITCIYVQLIKYQLWLIYFLGIPLQVAIILWSALLKSPSIKQNKPKKEKQKKEKVKKADKIAERELENSNEKDLEKTTESNLEEKSAGSENLKEEPTLESPKEKKVVREDDGFGYDFIKDKNNNNKN